MSKRLLFLPAILIGIIVGLAAGYMAYKATGGPLNFHGWMANEYFGNPVGAFQWAVGGAIVAVVAVYIRAKDSN
jgi:uncharacterized membrane-anchored protein YitT (DUF2179 family)